MSERLIAVTGATTLTVMPREPISLASDFENPIRPALDAA